MKRNVLQDNTTAFVYPRVQQQLVTSVLKLFIMYAL